MLDGNGSNYANAWVILTPWEERYAKGRSIDAIIADISRIVGPMQEARFLTFGLPAISGLGNTSGLDLRVQDRASAGREALGRGVEQVQVTASGATRRHRRVLELSPGRRPALPRHRPREGDSAWHPDAGRLPDAAGVARRRVCQRLQRVRAGPSR
jgi:hypothetical protein